MANTWAPADKRLVCAFIRSLWVLRLFITAYRAAVIRPIIASVVVSSVKENPASACARSGARQRHLQMASLFNLSGKFSRFQNIDFGRDEAGFI